MSSVKLRFLYDSINHAPIQYGKNVTMKVSNQNAIPAIAKNRTKPINISLNI